MQFPSAVRHSSLPSLRFAALLALAAIGALIAFWNAPVAAAVEPTDDAGLIAHQVEASPAEVESTWTMRDFLSAVPADASPAPAPSLDVLDFPDTSISAQAGDFVVEDPTALPQRLQGRAFFRIGSSIFTCSATLISSRYGNAVFTAGHCVFDIAGKSFVRDFVFVPGYENGSGLGLYAATTLTTTKAWARKGNFSGDIAIATLSGTPVADMGGARSVAFMLNPKRRKFTIYGYPGDPAPVFDGERLFGCRARFAGRDKGRPRTLAAYPCHMGHGASGGGWITHGYLNSVTSYFYCEKEPRACGFLFGPYFGKAARKLYMQKQVGGSLTPGIAIVKHPKRRTSKRTVKFRFLGLASTPLRYRCKFDHRRYVRCRSHTTISRLRPGRHSLRIKAWDQTGRRAANSPMFRFFVKR